MAMESIQNQMMADFKAKFPGSLERYQEAVDIFPAGVTHDARYFKPFPVYVTHAQGAHKWDVDGNRLIDCWMGHGALLLGHNHPAVVESVANQVQHGTHFGACHELELVWGQWVKRLIPSAERVRFVSSGTEATMMAIRLARGFTGRSKLIRFAGHFHGWHDTVMVGVRPPYDAPNSIGIPPDILKQVVVLPPNQIEAVEQTLAEHNDIAAIILEPAGGSNATIPTRPGYLAALRELCSAHNVILIFDEVITGFRYAPGGAQAYFNVTPDMTSLAKILGGGLPGGAVAGRADIMALLEFSDDAEANRHQRMSHPGTYNANPLSAAAGIATLEIAATGDPQEHSHQVTTQLIGGMNHILRTGQIPGCVYGDCSGFHSLIGQEDFHPADIETQISEATPERLSAGMGALGPLLRAAMLLEGVDLSGTGGRLSLAHTEKDVDELLTAFEQALDRMRRWGAL